MVEERKEAREHLGIEWEDKVQCLLRDAVRCEKIAGLLRDERYRRLLGDFKKVDEERDKKREEIRGKYFSTRTEFKYRGGVALKIVEPSPAVIALMGKYRYENLVRKKSVINTVATILFEKEVEEQLEPKSSYGKIVKMREEMCRIIIEGKLEPHGDPPVPFSDDDFSGDHLDMSPTDPAFWELEAREYREDVKDQLRLLGTKEEYIKTNLGRAIGVSKRLGLIEDAKRIAEEIWKGENGR